MISESRQRINYIIGDYFATNVAWLLFNVVRFYFLDTNRIGYGELFTFLTSHQLVVGQFFFPIMMIGIFYLSGYYNKVFLKSRLQEIVNTFSSSFIGMILIYFIALINDDIHDRLLNYELMGILLGIMFGMVYICRFCITQIATHNIHRRVWSFNTLIIGTSQAAVKLEEKLRRNKFDLEDLLDQMEQVQKMGSMKDILSMLPGINKKVKDVDIDDRQLDRMRAIIQSMTVKERRNPDIINPSRKRRIAAGCGMQVEDVNRLLNQYRQMQKMFKQMNSGSMKRKLKRMGITGGGNGMGGMGGMGGFGGFPM